jgi:hypothetical protein
MKSKWLYIAPLLLIIIQMACNIPSQVQTKVATSEPISLPTFTSETTKVLPTQSILPTKTPLPTQTLLPLTETPRPELAQPTPRPNGANWVDDDCSAIGGGRALFGLEYMNLATSNGRCHITANSNGNVLPVMYTFPSLDNAAVEIEISVDAITPESEYGIIFRGDEEISDGLAFYYLLSIRPGEQVITLSLWKNDQWTMISQQEFLEDLMVPGKPTHVRVEIVDNQIRIFLDKNFALEGFDDQIAFSGIFGISISTSSAPEIMHYDNFKIFSLAH